MSPRRARGRVHLFEGVDSSGVAVLREAGHAVTTSDAAASGRALREVLADAHGVGLRSRTRLTESHLRAARELLVVGCFSVGTNNVALDAATRLGIPVFHAPHASTRSVAELTVGLVIALARRLVEKSHLARRGLWAKDAEGSVEVRGKTLGIVGYGHIGSQVSVLAEALGMRVVHHDIADRQALGNASPAGSLHELLRQSDFVTLHVPGGPATAGLIGARELRAMKKGAALVNTSRGTVVDVEALAAALDDGRLSGAALDVLPVEPTSRRARLRTDLRRFDQVILTPHVGGSTSEAQRRIGRTVATKMARYLDEGSTRGAVNFPNVELPRVSGTHRLVHVHRNVPGVLSKVNQVFSRIGANVEAQYLKTNDLVGYLLVDLDHAVSARALSALKELPETIRARRLF